MSGVQSFMSSGRGGHKGRSPCICQCGCGVPFLGRRNQRWLNHEHAQRHYSRLARERVREEKRVPGGQNSERKQRKGTRLLPIHLQWKYGVAALGVLFAFLVVLPARASIAFVASSNGTVNGGTSVVSGSATTTAGNDLVVAVGMSNAVNACTVSTMTDGGSDTFTKEAAIENTNNSRRAEIWEAHSIAHHVNNKVTATLSLACDAVINVEEYSGVSATGNTGTFASSSPTTDMAITVTTQDANNFIASAYATNGAVTFSSGSGSTSRSFASNGGGTITGGAGDATSASAGSVTVHVTDSSSQQYAAAAVELRSGAAAPTCPKTLLTLGVGC